MSSFYDKVAKKFGSYQSGAKYVAEYPDGNPEQTFKDKLIELGGKEKVALDAGCADGRFTLSMASYFKNVVAIDISEGMLKAARAFQKQQQVANVSFENQNASHTTYQAETFDLIYSRRGPTPFAEFYRLLKPYGYVLDINIGEKDCQQIKEVFGRGQNYGERHESRLEKDNKKLTNAGFNIIFSKNYFYDAFYPSYGDLDLFLQGVPIFEDFNSKKDEQSLKKYVEQFSSKKGIRLPRHRVVIVARK